MTEFLRDRYWRGPRPEGEQTILGLIVGPDGLYGYGTWKHRELRLPGEEVPETVIDIPYFGVDERFHGALDSRGRKVADVLFATVEAVARLQSTPDMRVHLVCDVENVRGHRFWQRIGFRDAERLDLPEVSYIRMFR